MITSKFNATYENNVDLSRSPIDSILYELNLSYQFIRYDLTATVLPATLLIMAVSFAYTQPSLWLPQIAKSVIYFWLYMYIFALSNQYVGHEEDRINKPDRPIPGGLVSMEGTMLRWHVASLLFLFVGFLFGVSEWAVLWLGVTVAHNWLKWSWHWFGKNFLMGVATLAQLAAAWQIVHPLDDIGWRWVIMMSVLIFLIVAVQDLRDLEGDRAIGRLTMPMVFGEVLSRWYFSLVYLAIPFIVFAVVVPVSGMGLIALTHFSIMTFMCLVMAVRVVLKRDTHSDRVTYDWLTTWYMVVLSLSIWLI